jgi:3-dehydroquinate synthetase
LSRKAIAIDWSMPNPPVTPGTWHKWELELNPLVSRRHDQLIEKTFGWPEKTIIVLRKAFESKLGRGQGWDISALGSFKETYRHAAKFYKRGVAVSEEPLRFEGETQKGSYEISFVDDLDLSPFGDRFFIVDKSVRELWPDKQLPENTMFMQLSEQTKSIESVELIIQEWLRQGRPKEWMIVGGGVLSDVASFAASIAQANFIFAPTTFLAMIDACVGGKTGINYPPYGKNQLGSFHFPKAVVIWSGWLKTLPERQFRAGGAEALKHAFLKGDLDLQNKLTKAIASSDQDTLLTLIPGLIMVKADIVAKDPGEVGLRACLNFGHTMAHALETYSMRNCKSGAPILHGEAVGVGLAFSLILSSRRAKLSQNDTQSMIDALKKSGCLLMEKDLAKFLGVGDLFDKHLTFELFKQIVHDKKNVDGKHTTSRWVLLNAPGEVCGANSGTYTIEVANRLTEDIWPDLVEVLP